MTMRLISLVLLCALVLPVFACGDMELQSQWKDRDITIDGNPRDWDGALELVKDAGFSFGLINDHKNLYIAMVVADQAKQRQIMMSGLYLWFDETAKKEKHFSVKFPIGMMENGMNPMDMKQEREPAGTEERKPGGMEKNDLAGMKEAFTKNMNEFLIATSDGAWQRDAVGSLEEVAVAGGFTGGALILEFKFPLAQSGPYGYGIGAGAGSTISLGVESPEIKMEDRRKEMPGGGPGGRPGGGPPGGMGGRPGGAGGGPPGMGDRRPERPEPIKLWTKVLLSNSGL